MNTNVHSITPSLTNIPIQCHHQGAQLKIFCLYVSVLVHPSDHQRMDIVMPAGRHIYLRAASMTERQQWLLALGMAKQGGVLPETPGKRN